MSKYSWKRRLSPWLCVHLLFLLLCLCDSSSSTVFKKVLQDPSDGPPLNTTPENRSPTSQSDDVTTAPEVDEAAKPPPTNVSEVGVGDAFLNRSSVPVIKSNSSSEGGAENKLLNVNDTAAPQLQPSVNSSAPVTSSTTPPSQNTSTASPSTRQPPPPSDQPTAAPAATEPRPPPTTTPESAHPAHAASNNGSTAGPAHTTTTTPTVTATPTTLGTPTTTTTSPPLVTATSPPLTTATSPPLTTTTSPPSTTATTMPPTAAAKATHPPTPRTAATTSPRTTAAQTKPPPPRSKTPPIQTSPPSTSNSTPTPTRTEPTASSTRGSVAEAAGGALTRQLADTASLLAVLLFGLLFFLVTVAVFVTQAYESYRRKDYTQVDYLINGMYSDSGV